MSIANRRKIQAPECLKLKQSRRNTDRGFFRNVEVTLSPLPDFKPKKMQPEGCITKSVQEKYAKRNVRQSVNALPSNEGFRPRR